MSMDMHLHRISVYFLWVIVLVFSFILMELLFFGRNTVSFLNFFFQGVHLKNSKLSVGLGRLRV